MLVTDFWQAFQKGKQLSNSTVWKNRTIAGGLLTSFLISLAAISKGFGIDLGVDSETIEVVGYGVAGFYSMFASVSTAITSAKVGLLAGSEDGAATGDT